jgi:glycosyltransferase involved in cell wall biosynthesis
MLRSKILLHTSLFESQGYVFLEGLKCGLDVVCFNVGFLPESKKIHICGDKKEMTSTIKSLLSKDPDYSPSVPLTMSDTVSRFNDLYIKSGFTNNR